MRLRDYNGFTPDDDTTARYIDAMQANTEAKTALSRALDAAIAANDEVIRLLTAPRK